MADKKKGEIPLVVDGREYTLVLGLDAMCALEDHFSTPEKDVTWDDIQAQLKASAKGGVSARLVRALLWAMLQQYHPEIDLKGAGVLVSSVGGMAGLMKALNDTFVAAAPDPADLKELGAGRPRNAQAAQRKSPPVPKHGEGSTSMPADAA